MDIKKKIAGLQKKGVTLTIQRHAVLEYLYKNQTHPTVEKIYNSLKARYPVISKATVYNTLDFLKKHGTIKEITIEKGNQMIRKADRLMAEAINVVADLYKDSILKKPAYYSYAYTDLLHYQTGGSCIKQVLFKMYMKHRTRTYQGVRKE